MNVVPEMITYRGAGGGQALLSFQVKRTRFACEPKRSLAGCWRKSTAEEVAVQGLWVLIVMEKVSVI